jgi:uncharacterized protein DUF1801
MIVGDSIAGFDVTVNEYLAALPPDRAAELKRVRAAIRRALPKGYEEAVAGKVIAYQVPLAVYPDTYNGHPLWLAALAAPKTTLTLHLMPVYASAVLLDRLKAGFAKAGKPLRMGKGCINFQTADDLALDAITEIVAGLPVQKWVEIARSAKPRSRA